MSRTMKAMVLTRHGRRDIETTVRYARLAHDSIHDTAERIAESIAVDTS